MGRVSRGTKKARQRALLTFKGPVFASGDAAETRSMMSGTRSGKRSRFEVRDAAALAKILKDWGCAAAFHYEKYQDDVSIAGVERWAKGLLIELDETPIGTFVELEGPPRAIDRAAKELGIFQGRLYADELFGLYAEECRRRGEKVGDMMFRKGRVSQIEARSIRRKNFEQTSFFS